MHNPERVRTGLPLAELDPSQIDRVFAHPLQVEALTGIANLLQLLDESRGVTDLYEIQGDLFRSVHGVETYRAACSRVAKRLRRGLSLPVDAPRPLGGGDPSHLASWRFELFVCERVGRQYRTVGDGLAWTLLKYDRRLVIACSGNERPGPMVDKVGLPYELGHVVDLMNRGQFGLLNDLTNCMRISDVTEFTDTAVLLREVKKARSSSSTQRDRAQAAVDALMADGPIPGRGPGSVLTALSTRYEADHSALRDAIGLARARGVQAVRSSKGRILVVTSLPELFKRAKGNGDVALALYEECRAAGMRRAGIESAVHHLVGHSGDSAGRSPTVAPWSIFPLPAVDRARIICDVVHVETLLSLDTLVGLLEHHDMKVDILLPSQSQRVPFDARVLSIGRSGRGRIVFAPALNGLLYEQLRPNAWASAMNEMLDHSAAEPEPVFAAEIEIWGHRGRRRDPAIHDSPR